MQMTGGILSSTSTSSACGSGTGEAKLKSTSTSHTAPKFNGSFSTSSAPYAPTSPLNANAAAHGDSPESLEKLLQVSVIVLRQAVDLVNESLESDAQLALVSKYIPGSTIGKHLRHATDHFALLLDSLSSSESERNRNRNAERELELNYDVRARGTPMETSRADACAALESCIARLQRFVPGVSRDRSVRLRAVTPYVQEFRSSFGRELWFAALHAVHHWSMIRVIAGELGIQLDDSFGVAPSTLVHHGSEGPLGKAKI